MRNNNNNSTLPYTPRCLSIWTIYDNSLLHIRTPQFHLSSLRKMISMISVSACGSKRYIIRHVYEIEPITCRFLPAGRLFLQSLYCSEAHVLEKLVAVCFAESSHGIQCGFAVETCFCKCTVV